MPSGNRTDRWLERSRNISQIILVALAIFGYFYTVRPIYRNQLLSEELSRKAMEMREKEESIRQLDNTRIKLEQVNKNLKEDNEIIAKEIKIYKKKSIQLRTNIMNLLLSDVKRDMGWQINGYFLWKKNEKELKKYFHEKGPPEKIDSNYIKQRSKAFQYLRILHEDDQKEIINFINSYVDRNKERLDAEIDRLYNLETPIPIFSAKDYPNLVALGIRSNSDMLFGFTSQKKPSSEERVAINPLDDIFEKISKEYERIIKK